MAHSERLCGLWLLGYALLTRNSKLDYVSRF
jgi:hypothetical protein